MSIKPGDFVIANAGKEKGKCFVVLSVENQFLYLCDGKNRNVSNPKKKKVKHIVLVSTGTDEICAKVYAGEITNREIRRALSAFRGNLTAENNIIE